MASWCWTVELDILLFLLLCTYAFSKDLSDSNFPGILSLCEVSTDKKLYNNKFMPHSIIYYNTLIFYLPVHLPL